MKWRDAITKTRRSHCTQLHPEITEPHGTHVRGRYMYKRRNRITVPELSEGTRIRVAVAEDSATAPLNENTRGLQRPHTPPAAWTITQTMTPTLEKPKKKGKLDGTWQKPQRNTNPTSKQSPREKRTLARDTGKQEVTPEPTYDHHQNNPLVEKITIIPGLHNGVNTVTATMPRSRSRSPMQTPLLVRIRVRIKELCPTT